MPELRFHAVLMSVIVKLIEDPIFSGSATIVTIENETAGHFVSLRQNEENADKRTVCIAMEEWPLVRDTIEKMLTICGELDAASDT